ncbi:CUB and sushi domain-containing protein 3-like [Mercenaria mercenaria]|uniref:CUB and sushi domain-containing protein 3-like n=1 Tax=Mercenaria mercenaria TaxID=6596 RepID=UPI00234F0BB0|nr:CUB and sushi domain-containing protein 3-like [Mercenaria mercenaria]
MFTTIGNAPVKFQSDCPKCIPICINNGTVLGNLNEVGSKIHYKCNHGYRDKNRIVSAVCKEDGTWNVTANCTRVCNDLPTLHNQTVSLDKMNGNFFMETATVACHTGYQKCVGTIKRTVSDDWENAACDPLGYLYCGNPVSPANGTIVSNSGTILLDTATVTCDDRYQSSVDVISCTASGQWDTVTCDRISCGNPVSPANGTIVPIGDTMFLDTASVTCDDGYQSSVDVINCTASGEWNTRPCEICLHGQLCDMHSKQCKYKECIPTRINNGTVLGNLNEVGSKIRYKCNHGYRDKNRIKSAVCKEDGTWNVTANCTRGIDSIVFKGKKSSRSV